MWRPSDLRTSLLLLVLLAVIPPFGAIAYSAFIHREHAAEAAKADATQVVRTAAREQGRLITTTQQMLAGLATISTLQQPGSACNNTLAEINKSHPYYTDIGLATRDGRVVCNSRVLTRAVNIADRTYFRRSLASSDFSIGEYQIGRVTGEPAINFGYPVLNADGVLTGIVYAALSLDWLAHLITVADLPRGSIIFATDNNGTILAHYPGQKGWVGQSARHVPLVQALLAARGPEAIETEGIDGVRRLFAYAPLHEGATANVWVAVGIPTTVAFAEVNKGLWRNMTTFAIAALLALIAAWVGSNLFVLRRINALVNAAERLGKGDLTSRTGLPHGDKDIGRLARTFDDMAASLQRVNRALMTLSAGNRATIRATDEQTLLAEMCQVIVDAGGYRFTWIGFAEQDARKSVRSMAYAGLDANLEKLRAVLDNVTWADEEYGRGPVGTAIRTGKPVVVRNIADDASFKPWRDEAVRNGLLANATLPLVVQNSVIGALSIYSADANAFDAEELDLLGKAARDLAFGIEVLRTRSQGERAQATIQRMAYFDRLTGLPNHAQFEERLRRELWRADGHSLAVVMLNLNRLREINDVLGFHHGDLVLRDVGARIRNFETDEISIARLRGDEFALLINPADAARASDVMLRVLEGLREPFAVGELSMDVSATAGIALFPQHGADGTHLLRCADVALQQARKTGKDYAFYAADQDVHSARRLALAGELRRAIEADELVLYYQPKIDVTGTRVCGAEALVRWRHPSRGMIPPDDFIAIAERTGLIKPLTDWVLTAALRQAAAWREARLALPVAVNLSVRNLQDTELLKKIERLLTLYSGRPDWLELEITEGAVMEDPDGAWKVLTQLSAMGIKLYIDDFGTGYSSLGYLQKLPVDAIKIDKSFVVDMLNSTDSATIVRSTIDLAHDLGMKVVAEGVESQAVLERLAMLGCDMAQGYHFSTPLPAADFISWCDSARAASAPSSLAQPGL